MCLLFTFSDLSSVYSCGLCLYLPTGPAGPERSAALRCHIVVRPSQQRFGEFLLLSPPADPRLCEGESRRFTHFIWNTTELQVAAKVLRAPELPSGSYFLYLKVVCVDVVTLLLRLA